MALEMSIYTTSDPAAAELVCKLHTSMHLMCRANTAWENMLRYGLSVKHTPVGLGVFNGRRKIPELTLVALYPGEVRLGPVSDDYAIELQDTPYVVVGGQKFSPFGDMPEILPINGGLYNHACERSNCYTVTVQPPNCMPFVAVYTSRTVRPHEQLRYNYSDGYWTATPNDHPCLCHNARSCPRNMFKAK
jgi:hypothetical protein